MDKGLNEVWYCRLEEPNMDLNAAYCPACNAPYQVGPIFDHDPRSCTQCGAVLIEWNMMTSIFIIDRDQAPALVRNIIEYLAPCTEQQADEELLQLLRFLGVIKY